MPFSVFKYLYEFRQIFKLLKCVKYANKKTDDVFAQRNFKSCAKIKCFAAEANETRQTNSFKGDTQLQ